MKTLLILLSTLALFGCSQSDEFATDLREYSINDLHTVVGVGAWKDGKFVIESYDGNTWDIPKEVPIYEKAVTLDSFKRVTK